MKCVTISDSNVTILVMMKYESQGIHKIISNYHQTFISSNIHLLPKVAYGFKIIEEECSG